MEKSDDFGGINEKSAELSLKLAEKWRKLAEFPPKSAE
jgi:hypothetical protein